MRTQLAVSRISALAFGGLLSISLLLLYPAAAAQGAPQIAIRGWNLPPQLISMTQEK